MTPLAAAADIVLPGAAWVEKEATYTNDRGMLQATARVMAPRATRARTGGCWRTWPPRLGLAMNYCGRGSRARGDRGGDGRHAGVRRHRRGRHSRSRWRRRTWLQASNPSERWKWDHMFQDLPPVKGMPLIVRGDLTHEK